VFKEFCFKWTREGATILKLTDPTLDLSTRLPFVSIPNMFLQSPLVPKDFRANLTCKLFRNLSIAKKKEKVSIF
jgi:hypothetical protein